MYARMISFITIPGKRTELCAAIEETVTPMARQHRGFVDYMTLISDEEPRIATVISLWRTKADAVAFQREGFRDVLDVLQPFLESPPQVRTFDCFTATEASKRLSSDKTKPPRAS
jgi:quinol monooxygenase YgiN